MKTNGRIFTVSNAITFLGMVCVLISAYFVHKELYLLAFYFFLGVIASDYLDGLSARLIEKKWSGWGISRCGEVFDPVRDKSVIIIVFVFNIPIALLIVAIEAVSVYYANRVRDVMKHHHITYGSKVVTFLQATLMALMLFSNEYSKTIVLVLAVLSFVRLMTYFLKYQSLTKKSVVIE